MATMARIWKGAALLAAAFLGGMAGSWAFGPDAPQAGPLTPGPGTGIVGTFGVGGVITWEGELWQYRPDKGKWVTLDESFALEGQATSVIPLPIPADRIRHMETFGFLVDDADDCWLYNLDERRWEKLGKPPFHDPRR